MLDYLSNKLNYLLTFLLVLISILVICLDKGTVYTVSNKNKFKVLDSNVMLVNSEEKNTVKYAYEEVSLCSSSAVKTYMDYRAITNKNSTQYKYIQANMHVDPTTGMLVSNEDPTIYGVALGTFYGEIGSMYEVTLENGTVFKIVKVEIKSDNHTVGGCYQSNDKSVIEFLLDKALAKAYYGQLTNSYILNGNFDNYNMFNGKIATIKKIIKQ